MLYDLVVPSSIKTLRNLSQLLDKGAAYAEQKKVTPEVLLNSRLAIDQFPLTRQVQIACDTAKLGAARLAKVTAPSHEDNEKTLAECQARINSTISFLETLKRDQFQGAEERKITTPRWEGKWLTGHDYTMEHVLPNLYFHVTTAYSILRQAGADVGKKDYLGPIPYKS